MSLWRFEVILDTPEKFSKVLVPDRMNREVQEVWNNFDIKDRVLSLHRDTESKVYRVQLRHLFTGQMKFETYLRRGWNEFVTSNNLRMHDRIVLTLEDHHKILYMVRIWRGSTEITVVDSFVLIDNDGSISDSDIISTEYVPREILIKTPFFEFTFSKGYMDKPKINIPVSFALAHFQDHEDPTEVEMHVSKWWKGTMRMSFDSKHRIMSCDIKKGVTELIKGEGVKEGEKALVEMEGTDPPSFTLTFT
ncbi:uncharacterized protein LOC110718745 [Chenopodium quinoa]|uniref:uncharacterized protein LOC110718745 n=1 Tax=Chenopodium quinoa TaxID=63459 RepID=UPI000B782ADD|nr:uncharacterized protein LOC110718745 [Chenopodium quinoa]